MVWDREGEAAREYHRRVGFIRRGLERDAEFHDGIPLRVRREQWAPPLPLKPDLTLSVFGIGLSGEEGRVPCSAEQHIAWLTAAHAYVNAVDTAADAALVVRERVRTLSAKSSTHLLWWRLRELEREWAEAESVFLDAVRSAEAAYRPVREQILAAEADLRRKTDAELAEQRAADAERHRKGRELGDLSVWRVAVTDTADGRDAFVFRDDVPAEGAVSGADADSPHESEPLSAASLESELSALKRDGVTIRWDPAAQASVEAYCDLTFPAWWHGLFPRSPVLREPPSSRSGRSGTTGTGHHSSYGAGGFSCAGSY